MVARQTPDQKAGCSSHSGVTYFFNNFSADALKRSLKENLL